MTTLRLALLGVTALAIHATHLAGQGTSRVRVDENVRRDPNGALLGRLAAGAPVTVVEQSGDWVEVDIEGWVWLNSLQLSDGEYDLVVSVPGGENLRSAPSGNLLGRLEGGTLLDELERRPGWARVRRRAWMWSASVEQVEVAARAPSGVPTGSGTPRPAAATEPATARELEGFATIGPSGAPILNAPDGDTLAQAAPESDLEVVSREGNWVRVRVEGWIWMPRGAEGGSPEAAPTSALTPADLEANPDAAAGRVVAWDLQFISLERAEAIRTDFREGEPFLLTRHGGPEGPFVYVAVPPERLTEVEGLVPLERISVTGRVRTAASSLTRTPIIDLLSLGNTR